MKNLLSNFEANGRTRLNKVNYQSLPAVRGKEPLNLIVEDDIEPSLTDHGIMMDVIRHVYVVPKALFDLEVSFTVKVPYSNNADHSYLKSIDLKKALLEEEKIPWTSEALSKASLIISQLTLDDENIPIVTPPSFIKEK